MFGIYRRTYGDTIVKSSYDFETSTIGPYKLPIKINHVETENANLFPEYKFYEALVNDSTALAVFNVNNYCLCVVSKTMAYEKAATDTPKIELVCWPFRHPLNVPTYESIGYVKSYHDCLAVSQMPNSLLRDVATKEVLDFTEPLVCEPFINPPLSLYRELLTSDAKAVYMDKNTMQPKFLYK